MEKHCMNLFYTFLKLHIVVILIIFVVEKIIFDFVSVIIFSCSPSSWPRPLGGGGL